MDQPEGRSTSPDSEDSSYHDHDIHNGHPDKENQAGFCSAYCMDKESFQKEINKELPKTSDLFITCNLPKRFEYPHWFNGYGSQGKKVQSFYRTTSMDYGWFPPSYHSVPQSYYPLNGQFTKTFAQSGMYQDRSLNTKLSEGFRIAPAVFDRDKDKENGGKTRH